MDLIELLSGLTTVGWFLVAACLGGWLVLTYYMGEMTEKAFGDRESGALVGFFAPGVVLLIAVWLLR